MSVFVHIWIVLFQRHKTHNAHIDVFFKYFSGVGENMFRYQNVHLQNILILDYTASTTKVEI